jgi:GT2 family glycosyltransferase
MLEIVSATRGSELEFWNRSALGISLRRLGGDSRLVPRIAFRNKQGLPHIYNARIESGVHDILVFIHDDVWIDDYWFADRLLEALGRFDVVGAAGCERRVPFQPSWGPPPDSVMASGAPTLSGAVAHGQTPFGAVAMFGAAPAACELLDGLMLVARKSVLQAKGVRFDPRFDFHFYDLDFCRSAHQAGLRLGTWPLCLTHRSGGAFGTPAWRAKSREYFEKWHD